MRQERVILDIPRGIHRIDRDPRNIDDLRFRLDAERRKPQGTDGQAIQKAVELRTHFPDYTNKVQ